MKRHIDCLFGLFAAVLLAGCSAMGDKDSILPQDGPSMQDVYDRHFKDHGHRQKLKRDSVQLGKIGPAGSNSLAGYTREVHSEIENLFPRLPNPPLVMYVFPHLTDKGQPVPGYATSFPMYEKIEFALPGEAEGR